MLIYAILDIDLRRAAPEVRNEASQSNYRIYSEKSDVWSYAMLLYELILLQMNEDDKKIDDWFSSWSSSTKQSNTIIENDDYEEEEDYNPKPPCPSTSHLIGDNNLTVFYESVLLKCWTRNSLMRASFNELDEIIYNYFDCCEPDYRFHHHSISNSSIHKKSKKPTIETEKIGEVEEKNPDQISLGVLIKSGINSELWTGKFYNESSLVTIKRFKSSSGGGKRNNHHHQHRHHHNKSTNENFSLLKRFTNELEILKSLQLSDEQNHPSIIRFLARCTQSLMLVMEPMRYGSLLHFLSTIGTASHRDSSSQLPPPLTYERVVLMCGDVAHGLRYLANVRVIHGDVAARNLLVGDYDKYSDRYKVKIADFEHAYRMPDEHDYVEVSFKERKKFSAPLLT